MRQNTDVEVWKIIEGTNGNYEVSNTGKVKSLRSDKILKTRVDKGYEKVNISTVIGPKTCLVHRLVATHFIPNPENKTQVNHLDENPLNNNASNLQWCTPKENSNWGSRNERIKESKNQFFHTGERKTPKRNRIRGKNRTRKMNHFVGIEQIDVRTNEVIAVYPNIKEATRKTGVRQSNISDVCRGARKTTAGFKWRYKKK